MHFPDNGRDGSLQSRARNSATHRSTRPVKENATEQQPIEIGAISGAIAGGIIGGTAGLAAQ